MSGGFLYLSDDDRHADVIESRGFFTDALPSAPKLGLRQVALVSLTGDSIDLAALMTRGTKAASLKWRVKFEDLTELDPPLHFQELQERLSPTASALFGRVQGTKGVSLDGPIWDEFRQVITDLRPNLDLGPLERKVVARRPRAPSDGREPIVAYEYDAVGLALSLAGLDRRPVLESWSGSSDAPFLQGLPEFRLLEDRMIEHDARVFGDWAEVRHGAVGMAEFQDGDRRLTVINVNRAGVEHAVGVDLVYYRHDFDAYVVVQYKRMTPRSGCAGYEFRPDKQLRKELDRMRKLISPEGPPVSAREFRLHDGCAYLKLCPSTTRDAFSHELIHGMYLPLPYWDVLVSSPDVRGRKGGLVVDFDNVGRHINNTLFIELVGSSWIGSRGVTSEQITAIIHESLASRSVILAEAERNRSARMSREHQRTRNQAH